MVESSWARNLSPTSRRSLAELGEDGFHRWLYREGVGSRGQLLPPGDDCVALPGRKGRALLLTTDAVVEGSHFPPGTPGEWVGRFAAQVNLSDLAAKGGEPRGFLCAMQLPSFTPARWAEGVVRGILAEGRKVGAPLLGGDTKASRSPTVTLTAVGEGDPRRLMPRDGGRPGDLLVTTGTVGAGGARFLRWKASGSAVGPELRRLLTVRARLREGRILARYARATLDTSDGFLWSVRLLAEASGLSATVDLRELPFDAACLRGARAGLWPLEHAAFLGGDYELLAALPARRFPEAQAGIRRLQGDLTAVGRLSRKGGHQLVTDRGVCPLPATGWDAFSPERR